MPIDSNAVFPIEDETPYGTVVKAYIDDNDLAVVALINPGGTGDMLASMNLSDVADIATARANLDVFSKAETDVRIASGSRTTFSDTNYTVLATDRYVAQSGTLTAPRTVLLPAANAVPAGRRIMVADESGSPTETNTLTISVPAFNILNNENDRANTTSIVVRSGFAVHELISDGVTDWTVVTHGLARPYVFWQHPRAVAYPSGVWCPQPWNQVYVDVGQTSPGFHTATTTVAAGSNGAVLPQATINVASTAAFPTAGYGVITGPPGSGVDTVFAWTGKTGTSFTGCNTAGGIIRHANISTGTLATGQTVTGANCRFAPATPVLWALTAEVGWQKSDTGVRKIRFFQTGLEIATNTDPALDIEPQHMQVTVQPGYYLDADPYGSIDVYQDSGTVQIVRQDVLQSPLLMMYLAAGQ